MSSFISFLFFSFVFFLIFIFYFSIFSSEEKRNIYFQDLDSEGFGLKSPLITDVLPVSIRQQTKTTQADCYSSDLQQIKIDHEQKFCQDRINFLQMLNKPLKFGSKECKYVPKWRNIAKSGHTDRCTYGFIFKHCVSQNGSSPPSTKVFRRKKHNNSSYN